MKKSHGGARPGAGRPAGGKNQATLEREEARKVMRARVIAELAPLLEAQIANAKGLKYLVVRDKATGKFLRVAGHAAEKLKPAEEIIEMWEKDPSIQAFTDLMNRTFDKPKEHVEMTGADGGPVLYRWKES